MNVLAYAPPSPQPSDGGATPSVSVSPSPTVLPKTGINGGDIGWFVIAAIALVVIGAGLMSLIARSRRADVH